MHQQTTDIVILGGGYAGVIAALRIAGKTKRLPTTVTLVNGLAHFVERPRLHEMALGANLPHRPLAEMLAGTKAKFVQGWVTSFNPQQQTVQVKTNHGEQSLSYDYLVYALGSRSDRSQVAGVDAYAYTLDGFGSRTAADLNSYLHQQAKHKKQAVVVGGGATGVEAAAQLKAIHPHLAVSLVTQGKVGAFKGADVQVHIERTLREQGILLYERQPVKAVTADQVQLVNQQPLPADFCLWAGGFVAPPLARQAGLAVNEKQQLLVDPYLRTLSHDHIFAVGDAAAPVEEPGAPVRMSVFVALVTGAHAADNIVRQLKNKTLKPLSFHWYGQGIALGPDDAIGFNTFPNDQPSRPFFRGRTAVKIRNFFLWYLGFALELERRIPGSFFWTGRRRYARQKRQEEGQIEAVLNR